MFFLIALFIMAYQFVIVNQGRPFSANSITYAFYAVDYSMGFCSRMLPGAVYNLLVGVYNMQAVSAFLYVLYFAFVLLLSFLLEKFVCAFPENKQEVYFLMFLFLTGPFTLEIFFKEFGMLDFHWALLFAIACLFLRHRFLRFLIPLLVVLMNMTHYGAMICYVAAVLLLLLFFSVKATTKQERYVYLLLFFITLLVGIGSTVFFLINDSNDLVYSLQEFDKILSEERHSASWYYDFYLYKYIPSDMLEAHPFFKAANDLQFDGKIQSLSDLGLFIISQIKTTFSFEASSKFLTINFSSIFLFVFLGYILFAYFKENKNLIKRFLSFLFFALALLISLAGMLFSTDNTRWLGHSFIILFVFVFFVLYYDYRAGIKKIQTLLSKPNMFFVSVFLFFYAFTVIDPYTFEYLY